MMADNRTDFIINLADIKRSDSVLTIGVAHMPELEKIIEGRAKSSNCIDIDLKKINHAKKYAKKTRFILGDITKPNKRLYNKFDTIIMLEVLEHIKDDYSTLENIRKMLKKNGKLIITVPNKHPLHILNPLLYTQHYRHYSLKDITQLLKKAGFSIKYTNTVESAKLLIDLYVHLFCKFILRKSVKFGVLTSNKDKTYTKTNRESKALDSLVVAAKD
jgi:SAM-dependent methyltransferase